MRDGAVAVDADAEEEDPLGEIVDDGKAAIVGRENDVLSPANAGDHRPYLGGRVKVDLEAGLHAVTARRRGSEVAKARGGLRSLNGDT